MPDHSQADRAKKTMVSSEKLAYWYLRLNGFMTIPNFVVHPDRGVNQRTDVDILGVRFPHRAELLDDPMEDEDHFTRFLDKPLFVFAEVKRYKCELNGPWTRPERQNMQRVLRAVGAFPIETNDAIATALYENGVFFNDVYCVSLYCFGERRDSALSDRYPDVPQITWGQVFAFIFQRFKEYKRQKCSHPQWDNVGKALWNAAERARDVPAFVESISLN